MDIARAKIQYPACNGAAPKKKFSPSRITRATFSTRVPNLIELFKVLGRDITETCADVFFTNFCPGYRLGNEGGSIDIANRNFNRQRADWQRICLT